MGVDVGMHLKSEFSLQVIQRFDMFKDIFRDMIIDYRVGIHAELCQKIGSGVNSFFLGCSPSLLFP